LPENESENEFIIGIALALLCSIFYAIMTITTKKLNNQNVNYVTNAMYSPYFGIPITFVVALIIDLTHVAKIFKRPVLAEQNEANYLTWQIVYVLLGSTFVIVFQLTFALALKFGDASKISIILSTDLLFAFLFQYELLGIASKWMAIVGSILILLGSVLIALFKIVEDKRAERRMEMTRNGQSIDETIKRESWVEKILFFKF
jgi:drug/metabolite transporter (DMT)-like permease